MPRDTVLEQAGKASSKREFFIKDRKEQPYKDLTAFQVCRGDSQCKGPKSEAYVRCPEAAARRQGKIKWCCDSV